MRVLVSWLARRAAAATVAVAVPISRKRRLLVAIYIHYYRRNQVSKL
jgi:hypothetical protein